MDEGDCEVHTEEECNEDCTVEVRLGGNHEIDDAPEVQEDDAAETAEGWDSPPFDPGLSPPPDKFIA